MSAPPEKLTILQLVPEPLPTHRPDLCELFGRFLPRSGIDCRIVGHAAAAQAPGQASSTADWVREDRAFAANPAAPRFLREAAYLLLALRRLASARRDGVDLIQVRDMVSLGLMAWAVARLTGVRFAWWMSFPMSEDRIARASLLRSQGRRLRSSLLQAKGRLERALLYRFLLPRADHVFVQSAAMQEMLRGQGLRREMTPVPMCVDCSLLAPGTIAPRRPAGWEASPLFVYLGTLDAGRDLDSLVRALALLRQRHEQARLLLVGDASTEADRVALRHIIEKHAQQEAVQVTGWLPRAQALQYLVGAHACISWCPRSPVLDVGTPTKLIECLALAVPVVANDHPDQAQILKASGAGLLCQSNAQALAEAMRQALADPGAARERAQHGPAWVRRERNYERLAVELAQCYRRLLWNGLESAQMKSNRWG